MPADSVALLVGADDHRHGVPANDVLDAALGVAVAGIIGLFVDRDRVHIGRGGRAGKTRAAAERLAFQAVQKVGGPLRTGRIDHVVDGVDPFRRFAGIVVVGAQRKQAAGQRVGRGGGGRGRSVVFHEL